MLCLDYFGVVNEQIVYNYTHKDEREISIEGFKDGRV
jgi:hypothetical protein